MNNQEELHEFIGAVGARLEHNQKQLEVVIDKLDSIDMQQQQLSKTIACHIDRHVIIGRMVRISLVPIAIAGIIKYLLP